MPLLTAREHLVLFARLRGIPEHHVNKVAEWVRGGGGGVELYFNSVVKYSFFMSLKHLFELNIIKKSSRLSCE
jgi:hypothetical protein